MLNIHDCMEKRREYPLIEPSRDAMIGKINEAPTQKEIFFLVTEGFFSYEHSNGRKEFLDKYCIAGIFDLGNVYTDTAVNMVLVHAVAESVSSVKVGIYTAQTFDKKAYKYDGHGYLVIPDSFLPQYNAFINAVENWVNQNVLPNDSEDGAYEFNVVPADEMDLNKLYPRYYTKKAVEVRKLAEKESFVKLSDVADVIPNRRMTNTGMAVKILKPADFSYPLDIDSLAMEAPTKIMLQRGDIVFPTTQGKKPYLFNIDSEVPVYASQSEFVIKCRNMLPEYLFLYLNSDVSACLYDMLSKGAGMKRLSLKDIMDLPVAKPSLEDEKYINDFNLITNVNGRNYGDYEQYKRLKEYYDHLNTVEKKDAEPECLEDIINIEDANKIKMHNEEQLRSFLNEDLKELNTCFAHHAYKATLILAGSILEAVLIDWLSEIRHKNYFDEDYMIFDERTGRERRADLVDYINEINELEYPDWMEEASKAHVIRKKRNLVHAKLCMKSDEINEEACRQVIDYLKDVLKTRGVA